MKVKSNANADAGNPPAETPVPDGPVADGEGIDESAIAEYLLATPSFFDRFPSVLADARLPDLHRGRALSLHERQLAQLREQRALLERRLASLMAVGHENDALAARLQHFTRELLLTGEASAMPGRIIAGLREHFSVPMAAMRLWGVAEQYAALPEARAVDSDTRALADDLHRPYCGLTGRYPQTRWLAGGGEDARSMALLALRRGAEPRAFGLIVLGSADGDRFQTGMATDVLERIGEIASASLSRLMARADDARRTDRASAA
ncbi:MAG: DUF484 family protein [Burkholderiaceae bacterium]